MLDFDALRAAVVGGDGVVARFPGLVAVAQGPDDPLRRLIEMCREAAGATPGRALARRLAAWLGGAEAPPEALQFGTVAATEKGLAVFLSGGVSMLVPELGTTVSGADVAAWADRLLDWPDVPVVLTIDGVPTPLDLMTGVLDLRTGVVPGVAVVAVPAGAAQDRAGLRKRGGAGGRPGRPAGTPPPGSATPAEAPEPALVARGAAPGHHEPTARAGGGPGEPAGLDPDDVGYPTHHRPHPPVPVPPAVPNAGTAVRPPRRAEAILGVDPAESVRAPLEVGAAVAGAGRPGRGAKARPPESGEPQARGHLCSRGHLNDPRSHFCVLCGIRMNERTGVLVLGSRPPLGLVVFDDGATYTVDAAYVVGRMPEADERVRSGALRSILVEDRTGSVSRVHAEIRVNGWDVELFDSGSSNGTFVAAPGEQAWVPVPARQSRRLVPGTRVRLGGRTFVFESPSGVR